MLVDHAHVGERQTGYLDTEAAPIRSVTKGQLFYRGDASNRKLYILEAH